MAFLRDIEKLIRNSIPMTDRRSDQRRPAHPQPHHGAARPAGNGKPHRGHRSNQERKHGRRHQSDGRSGRRAAASIRLPSCSSVTASRVATIRAARSAQAVIQEDHKVTKEELLEFEGLVTEILPDARYRIQLDNEHELVAYSAGRMRKNRIKTLAGDRVTVEVSPYDLEKGRLIFRHKDERAGILARAPQRHQFRRR